MSNGPGRSAGVARMEPVFRTLEIAVTAAVAVSGSRITYHGLENIPERGGAVVAINHTSYIDWLPSALAAYKRHRRLRFMIKEEMTEVKVVSFLIKHTGTIPVDRRAGAGAYAVAVERLRAGELVAVYPEATISRSFELKEFKTGAARMAHRSAGADHPADRVGCTPALDQGPSAQARPREDSDDRHGRRAAAPGRDHRTDRRRDARGDDDAAARRSAVLRASRGGVLGAAADGRLRADDGRGQVARRGRARRAGPQAGGATGESRGDTARADRQRRGRHAARRGRERSAPVPATPCALRWMRALDSCWPPDARRDGCTPWSTRWVSSRWRSARTAR